MEQFFVYLDAVYMHAQTTILIHIITLMHRKVLVVLLLKTFIIFMHLIKKLFGGPWTST